MSGSADCWLVDQFFSLQVSRGRLSIRFAILSRLANSSAQRASLNGSTVGSDISSTSYSSLKTALLQGQWQQYLPMTRPSLHQFSRANFQEVCSRSQINTPLPHVVSGKLELVGGHKSKKWLQERPTWSPNILASRYWESSLFP